MKILVMAASDEDTTLADTFSPIAEVFYYTQTGKPEGNNSLTPTKQWRTMIRDMDLVVVDNPILHFRALKVIGDNPTPVVLYHDGNVRRALDVVSRSSSPTNVSLLLALIQSGEQIIEVTEKPKRRWFGRG